MVAAGEEERDQDGVRRAAGVEAGERVGEEGLVELDVPEVHGQAGALLAHAVEERADRVQGARVAAAVGDDDQRGRAGAPAAVELDEA